MTSAGSDSDDTDADVDLGERGGRFEADSEAIASVRSGSVLQTARDLDTNVTRTKAWRDLILQQPT